MDKHESLLRIFPPHIRNVLCRREIIGSNLNEIRLRINAPLFITVRSREINAGITVKEEDIKYITETICRYSLYAYEEEMKQGYITIEGGHRIGLAGKIVLLDSKIKTMSSISGMNVRIANEKKGCADDVMGQLINDKRVCHTLIMSPPGGGKTTLLRDIIRQISNGGINVGVVDERSEIGACFKGVPSNDVGIRTDILDACTKPEGIVRLVRTMAPDVIAVDEIGGKRDYEAIGYALTSGCSIIATIHGSDFEDLKKNIYFKEVYNTGLFERLVIPKGVTGKKNDVFIL